MPHRSLVADRLARLLNALGHPHRVRIVAELRSGEMDVSTLRDLLGGSQSAVSQHLAVLRASHLVAERREGRQVFYRLTQPDLAAWLLDGARYIGAGLTESEAILSALAKARQDWRHAPDELTTEKQSAKKLTAKKPTRRGAT